jgi:hypothetical protein
VRIVFLTFRQAQNRGGAVPEPDVTIDTIRTIDDIFIRLGEASVGTALSIDDAVEELWSPAAFASWSMAIGCGSNRSRGRRLSGCSWHAGTGPSSRRDGACCAACTRLSPRTLAVR